jgi:hypothetical protein
MATLNRDWVVQPHGPLTRLDDRLWSAEGVLVMPLGRFPRRMTVVELAGGGTAVWSAIPLAEPEMAKLEALGPVRVLIVPNQGHRLDVAAWQARYPDAVVVAPPGAEAAVGEAATVGATDAAPLADPSLELGLVAGTRFPEFYLRVERPAGWTLVLNDVLSRIAHPPGVSAWLLARLFGFGVDRPRTARLVRRKYLVDEAALARQFRDWAALPGLRRIVTSHVDVIETDPGAALARAADDLD